MSKEFSPVNSQSKNILPSDPIQIVIPEKIGEITESFKGLSPQTVVLLQDAHGIPEAQRNVSRLIRFFINHYGVREIGVEGVFSELDPQIFKSYPDSGGLKKVFKEYSDQGELTGPSAAAIFNKTPARYFGIEDWAVYEEGLNLYAEALRRQPGLIKKASEAEAALQEAKERIYPKELLEADRLISRIRKGQEDILKNLENLSVLKKPRLGGEISLLLEEAKSRPFSAQELDETKKIAGAIKSRIAVSSSSKAAKDQLRLNHAWQKFQTSEMTPGEFSSILVRFEAYLQSQKIPDWIHKHAAKHERISSLKGPEFFKQLNEFIREVQGAFALTEEEKRILAKSEKLALVQKLIRLEITREEWETIKRIQRSGDLLEGLGGLDLSVHFGFYENAQKRDEVFHQKIMDRFKALKADGIAAVIGGFHAGSMAARLRKENISYILAAPKIRAIPAHNSYPEQMKGNVSWKSYFQDESGQVNLYKAFVRAARDRLISESFGPPQETLRRWRDQILRDLAAQKKLGQASNYLFFIHEKESESEFRKLHDKWLGNVDRFIRRLKGLETAGALTEENILKALPGNRSGISSIVGASLDPQATRSSRRRYEPLRRSEFLMRKARSSLDFSDLSIPLELGRRSEMRAAPENPQLLEFARLVDLVQRARASTLQEYEELLAHHALVGLENLSESSEPFGLTLGNLVYFSGPQTRTHLWRYSGVESGNFVFNAVNQSLKDVTRRLSSQSLRGLVEQKRIQKMNWASEAKPFAKFGSASDPSLWFDVNQPNLVIFAKFEDDKNAYRIASNWAGWTPRASTLKANILTADPSPENLILREGRIFIHKAQALQRVGNKTASVVVRASQPIEVHYAARLLSSELTAGQIQKLEEGNFPRDADLKTQELEISKIRQNNLAREIGLPVKKARALFRNENSEKVIREKLREAASQNPHVFIQPHRGAGSLNSASYHLDQTEELEQAMKLIRIMNRESPSRAMLVEDYIEAPEWPGEYQNHFSDLRVLVTRKPGIPEKYEIGPFKLALSTEPVYARIPIVVSARPFKRIAEEVKGTTLRSTVRMPFDLFLKNHSGLEDPQAARLMEKVKKLSLQWVEGLRGRGYQFDLMAVDFILGKEKDEDGLPKIYFNEAASHFADETHWDEIAAEAGLPRGSFRQEHLDTALKEAHRYFDLLRTGESPAGRSEMRAAEKVRGRSDFDFLDKAIEKNKHPVPDFVQKDRTRFNSDLLQSLADQEDSPRSEMRTQDIGAALEDRQKTGMLLEELQKPGLSEERLLEIAHGAIAAFFHRTSLSGKIQELAKAIQKPVEGDSVSLIGKRARASHDLIETEKLIFNLYSGNAYSSALTGVKMLAAFKEAKTGSQNMQHFFSWALRYLKPEDWDAFLKEIFSSPRFTRNVHAFDYSPVLYQKLKERGPATWEKIIDALLEQTQSSEIQNLSSVSKALSILIQENMTTLEDVVKKIEKLPSAQQGRGLYDHLLRLARFEYGRLATQKLEDRFLKLLPKRIDALDMESQSVKSFAEGVNLKIPGISFRPFKARFRVFPVQMLFPFPEIQKDALILGIFDEDDLLSRREIPLGHVPNALAFASFYLRENDLKEKEMVIGSIQSDAYKALRDDPVTRQYYRDWRLMVRFLIEAYARRIGAVRIISPAAKDVMRLYHGDPGLGINPVNESLAKTVYDQHMNDLGYEFMKLEAPLLWEYDALLNKDLFLEEAWMKDLHEEDLVMTQIISRLVPDYVQPARSEMRAEENTNVEQLLAANRILQETGDVGFLIGSTGRAFWNPSSKIADINARSDVDILVLSPDFHLRRQENAGVDWWIPEEINLRGKKIRVYTNMAGAFIRADMEFEPSELSSLKPGLYLLPRETSIDFSKQSALAFLPPAQYQGGLDQAAALQRRIAEDFPGPVSPAWQEIFEKRFETLSPSAVRVIPYHPERVRIISATGFSNLEPRLYENFLNTLIPPAPAPQQALDAGLEYSLRHLPQSIENVEALKGLKGLRRVNQYLRERGLAGLLMPRWAQYFRDGKTKPKNLSRKINAEGPLRVLLLQPEVHALEFWNETGVDWYLPFKHFNDKTKSEETWIVDSSGQILPYQIKHGNFSAREGGLYLPSPDAYEIMAQSESISPISAPLIRVSGWDEMFTGFSGVLGVTAEPRSVDPDFQQEVLKFPFPRARSEMRAEGKPLYFDDRQLAETETFDDNTPMTHLVNTGFSQLFVIQGRYGKYLLKKPNPSQPVAEDYLKDEAAVMQEMWLDYVQRKRDLDDGIPPVHRLPQHIHVRLGKWNDRLGGILMPYLEGENAYDYFIDEGNRFATVYQYFQAALQMTGTVGFMHSADMAHLDIKLDNFFFSRTNGFFFLTDMNLTHNSRADRSVKRGGTRGYAPPEQWEEIRTGGLPPSDINLLKRRDVYSMGVTLLRLWLGGFTGDDQATDLRFTMIQAGQINETLTNFKNCPIEDILRKAMDPDPAKRYASVVEMEADIRRRMIKIRGSRSPDEAKLWNMTPPRERPRDTLPRALESLVTQVADPVDVPTLKPDNVRPENMEEEEADSLLTAKHEAAKQLLAKIDPVLARGFMGFVGSGPAGHVFLVNVEGRPMAFKIPIGDSYWDPNETRKWNLLKDAKWRMRTKDIILGYQGRNLPFVQQIERIYQMDMRVLGGRTLKTYAVLMDYVAGESNLRDYVIRLGAGGQRSLSMQLTKILYDLHRRSLTLQGFHPDDPLLMINGNNFVVEEVAQISPEEAIPASAPSSENKNESQPVPHTERLRLVGMGELKEMSQSDQGETPFWRQRSEVLVDFFTPRIAKVLETLKLNAADAELEPDLEEIKEGIRAAIADMNVGSTIITQSAQPAPQVGNAAAVNDAEVNPPESGESGGEEDSSAPRSEMRAKEKREEIEKKLEDPRGVIALTHRILAEEITYEEMTLIQRTSIDLLFKSPSLYQNISAIAEALRERWRRDKSADIRYVDDVFGQLSLALGTVSSLNEPEISFQKFVEEFDYISAFQSIEDRRRIYHYIFTLAEQHLDEDEFREFFKAIFSNPLIMRSLRDIETSGFYQKLKEQKPETWELLTDLLLEQVNSSDLKEYSGISKALASMVRGKMTNLETVVRKIETLPPEKQGKGLFGHLWHLARFGNYGMSRENLEDRLLRLVPSALADRDFSSITFRRFQEGQNLFLHGIHIRPFKGRFRVMPFQTLQPFPETSDEATVLGIFDEDDLLTEKEVPIGHVPTSLAFATFYVRTNLGGDKELILGSIQSDAYKFLRKDPITKQLYRDWRFMVRILVEAYARRIGAARIISPEAEDVARLYHPVAEIGFKGINPELAEIVYDQHMSELGYQRRLLIAPIDWEYDGILNKRLSLEKGWVKELSANDPMIEIINQLLPPDYLKSRSEMRASAQENQRKIQEEIEGFLSENHGQRALTALLEFYYAGHELPAPVLEPLIREIFMTFLKNLRTPSIESFMPVVKSRIEKDNNIFETLAGLGKAPEAPEDFKNFLAQFAGSLAGTKRSADERYHIAPAELEKWLFQYYFQLPFGEDQAFKGRYQFRECLGAGTEGIVFLVYDAEAKKEFAIKLMGRNRLASAEIFREKNAGNPEILQNYEIGIVGNYTFVVKDLLRGIEFDIKNDGEDIFAKPVSPSERLDILVKLASFLSRSMQNQFLPGDYQFFVSRQDSGLYLKFFDFGSWLYFDHAEDLKSENREDWEKFIAFSARFFNQMIKAALGGLEVGPRKQEKEQNLNLLKNLEQVLGEQQEDQLYNFTGYLLLIRGILRREFLDDPDFQKDFNAADAFFQKPEMAYERIQVTAGLGDYLKPYFPSLARSEMRVENMAEALKAAGGARQIMEEFRQAETSQLRQAEIIRDVFEALISEPSGQTFEQAKSLAAAFLIASANTSGLGRQTLIERIDKLNRLVTMISRLQSLPSNPVEIIPRLDSLNAFAEADRPRVRNLIFDVIQNQLDDETRKKVILAVLANRQKLFEFWKDKEWRFFKMMKNYDADTREKFLLALFEHVRYAETIEDFSDLSRSLSAMVREGMISFQDVISQIEGLSPEQRGFGLYDYLLNTARFHPELGMDRIELENKLLELTPSPLSPDDFASVDLSVPSEKLRLGRLRIQPFPGRLRILPFQALRHFQEPMDDAIFMGIFDQDPLLQEDQLRVSHAYDALAFGAFYKRNFKIGEGQARHVEKALVISAKQSDSYKLLREKLPHEEKSRTKALYRDWKLMIAILLEAYARREGMKWVISPSSEDVRRLYPSSSILGISGVDPQLAKIVYDQDMEALGYKLIQLSEIGIKDSLLWDGDLSLARAWVKELKTDDPALPLIEQIVPGYTTSRRSEMRASKNTPASLIDWVIENMKSEEDLKGLKTMPVVIAVLSGIKPYSSGVILNNPDQKRILLKLGNLIKNSAEQGLVMDPAPIKSGKYGIYSVQGVLQAFRAAEVKALFAKYGLSAEYEKITDEEEGPSTWLALIRNYEFMDPLEFANNLWKIDLIRGIALGYPPADVEYSVNYNQGRESQPPQFLKGELEDIGWYSHPAPAVFADSMQRLEKYEAVIQQAMHRIDQVLARSEMRTVPEGLQQFRILMHDFGNPLNILVTSHSILEMLKDSASETGKEQIDKIIESLTAFAAPYADTINSFRGDPVYQSSNASEEEWLGLREQALKRFDSPELDFASKNPAELIKQVQALTAPENAANFQTPAYLKSTFQSFPYILDLLELNLARTKEYLRGVPAPLKIEKVEAGYLLLFAKSIYSQATVILTPDFKFEVQSSRPILLNAVLNVMKNAKEAPGVSRVEISAHMNESGALELIFRDNGAGIPGAALARIFDLGFTTKSETAGQGIGLYKVRKELESAGAKIDVQSSTAEDHHGTTFTITIPLIFTPTAESSVRSEMRIAPTAALGSTIDAELREPVETLVSALYPEKDFSERVKPDKLNRAVHALSEKRIPVKDLERILKLAVDAALKEFENEKRLQQEEEAGLQLYVDRVFQQTVQEILNYVSEVSGSANNKIALGIHVPSAVGEAESQTSMLSEYAEILKNYMAGKLDHIYLTGGKAHLSNGFFGKLSVGYVQRPEQALLDKQKRLSLLISNDQYSGQPSAHVLPIGVRDAGKASAQARLLARLMQVAYAYAAAISDQNPASPGNEAQKKLLAAVTLFKQLPEAGAGQIIRIENGFPVIDGSPLEAMLLAEALSLRQLEKSA